MPLVSVIIPSYNCERFISQTLQSVLDQTVDDVEIIVVDDGSSDETVDIVASIKGPVQLVQQSNAGVCRARNRGIEMAQGAYICVLDHDDFWVPQKLQLQLDALEAHSQADIVFSSFLLWHPDENGRHPEPETVFQANLNDEIDPEYSGWIYHQFLLDCWMLTSTALFRREVFDASGVFDENLPYSEDWDLWLRMSRQHQFVKLRYPTTLYRQHPRQGNRVVRDVDYRTELLTNACEKWGLESPDGRRITKSSFNRKLAQYHIEFALSHLGAGNRVKGVGSLFNAWKRRPTQLRSLALVAASCVGWTPSDKGGD